jgi:hypothetical protein
MFSIDGDKLPRSARSGGQRRRARGQAWRALGQAFCQPTLMADGMIDNQSPFSLKSRTLVLRVHRVAHVGERVEPLPTVGK